MHVLSCPNARAFLPQIILFFFLKSPVSETDTSCCFKTICHYHPCPGPQSHGGWTEWLLSGNTGERPHFFQIAEHLPWANAPFLVVIGLSLSEKTWSFCPWQRPTCLAARLAAISPDGRQGSGQHKCVTSPLLGSTHSQVTVAIRFKLKTHRGTDQTDVPALIQPRIAVTSLNILEIMPYTAL